MCFVLVLLADVSVQEVLVLFPGFVVVFIFFNLVPSPHSVCVFNLGFVFMVGVCWW
jgi:hypothetical protein